MGPQSTLSAITLTLIFAIFTSIFGQSISSQGTRSKSMTLGAGDISYPSFGGSPAAFSQPGGGPAAHGMILPSDNSIDANEYMIGGGDVFFITVVESPSIRYTAAVDQSGRAFIPNVGVIDIGKISYTEAKKAISEYIASKMRGLSEVYVTLIQTKNATVSFTGSIHTPGSYEFPGYTRLFDAVLAVNGGKMPQPFEVNLRQVQLTSGDSSATYDLLAYLYNDDKSQNPYIYPGDHVRINSTAQSVYIGGAIKMPPQGFYPLKEGETLRDFLSMFTLGNTADTGNILVFKSIDNSKRTFSASDNHALSNLDAITVPIKKNQPGIHTVSISGEIASPGDYPLVENATTAKQLMEMAGGMKETGNISQIAVIRPSKRLPQQFSEGVPGMMAVRPERGAAISMTSASLDYTIIRLALYDAEKIILEPDDQLVIPKKDNFVYIGGAVKAPGVYPFRQGKERQYYIALAGGFSGNADKSNVQIYLKYGDLVQSIESGDVEAGSVIVVPVSTQYKFLSQVILPLITATATTIGVLLSIFSFTRQP